MVLVAIDYKVCGAEIADLDREVYDARTFKTIGFCDNTIPTAGSNTMRRPSISFVTKPDLP